MSDYASMYGTLFHSQTNAIEILQKAQQEAEDMYISACETNIITLDKNMYKTLFHSQTKIIELLQKAQVDAENIYINFDNSK